MEHFILAIILWAVVFIVLPFERIRELSAAAIIAFVWRVLIDNICVSLGYYRYGHTLIPIGYASLFQSLAAAAMGILMVNWLNEKSSSKILSVSLVSIGLSILENIYIQRGAFLYVRFDSTISFIQSIASLSIFVWLSLAFIGEKRVYSGIKSRLRARHIT